MISQSIGVESSICAYKLGITRIMALDFACQQTFFIVSAVLWGDFA